MVVLTNIETRDSGIERLSDPIVDEREVEKILFAVMVDILAHSWMKLTQRMRKCSLKNARDW